jgi:hypothetical protein
VPKPYTPFCRRQHQRGEGGVLYSTSLQIAGLDLETLAGNGPDGRIADGSALAGEQSSS